MESLGLLNIDARYATVLLVDLAIAAILVTSIKFVSGLISSINATDELSEKDNPAFGVSLAGAAFSVTIIMTGVMAGEASESLISEGLLVAGYGVLGIILMALTRFVFDRVSMPGFSVKQEVLKGNVAAGLLDAGNVVATAIIVRAVMIWADPATLSGVALVLAGYGLSQIILSVASFYRLRLFKSHHNYSMQEAIVAGNTAAAWRFSGYRIGVALAITAASSLIPYMPEVMGQLAGLWLVVSLAMMVFVSVLAIVADKIILSGIDTRTEVDEQGNVAVAVIQFVVVVSMGIIIAVLTS
ncbi:MAG: DUF350 domain-containing protein [Sphingomonadales bacterium]